MRFERVQFAVIGAGISGLACAHALARRGGDVVVLEASEHIGGRIETVTRDGIQLEMGPNTLMAGGRAGAALDELIDELGLRDRIVEASPAARRRYIGRAQDLVPLPTSPMAALTSPLIGPLGLARAAADLVLPVRHLPGESVAMFVRRRLGSRVLDNMVAPFLSGVHAGNVSRLEASSVFPTLVRAEVEHGSIIRGMLAARRRQRQEAGATGSTTSKSRSITFVDGMAELPRRLHEELGSRVATGIRVEELQETPGGCVLVLGDGSRLNCEHVVVATDMAAAGALLARVPRFATHALALSEAPAASMAVVSLVLNRADVRHALDGFGYLNLPSLERRILGCMFRSSIFPHAAPCDRVILSAFVGGAMHPSAVDLSDKNLDALVRAELQERLGLAPDARAHDVVIRRWRQAIPQLNVGHDAMKQRLAAAVQNGPVTLLGNYLSGLSLPDCIRGARDHAARLMPDAATPTRCSTKESSWVPPLSASS